MSEETSGKEHSTVRIRLYKMQKHTWNGYRKNGCIRELTWDWFESWRRRNLWQYGTLDWCHITTAMSTTRRTRSQKKKRKEKEMRIRSWRTGQKTTLSIRDGKNENKEEKLPQRNYVAKRLN